MQKTEHLETNGKKLGSLGTKTYWENEIAFIISGWVYSILDCCYMYKLVIVL